MIKYSETKATEGRKGWLWITVYGSITADKSWGGELVVAGHAASTVRKLRECNPGSKFIRWFSTFRVGLLTSINPMKRILHRYTQRLA